jgi:small-conductance mechanosensitive channel
MNDIFLGNTIHDWAIALGGVLLATVAVSLLRGIIVQRVEIVAARTDTLADDALVVLLRSIRKTYVTILALCIAEVWLAFEPPVDRNFKRVAVVVAILQGFRSANLLIGFWIDNHVSKRGGVDRTTLQALSIAAKTIVFFALLLVGLENLGFDIKTLIAGLGVGGIAIALALQNILGDLFAALSIIIDKPFVVGDTIAVDTFEGTVDHVGLKTTRMQSVNGEQIIFGNTDLLKSRIRNLTRREGRRMVFTISIAPGTSAADIGRVPQIIAATIADEAHATLQRTHLIGTGPLGFDVETSMLIPDPEFSKAFDVRQRILLGIYARLEEAKIELSRPATALTHIVPLVAPPVA